METVLSLGSRQVQVEGAKESEVRDLCSEVPGTGQWVAAESFFSTSVGFGFQVVNAPARLP